MGDDQSIIVRTGIIPGAFSPNSPHDLSFVIWTPGVTSGNPIALNLLPDFAAIDNKQDADTEDERSQAVEMRTRRSRRDARALSRWKRAAGAPSTRRSRRRDASLAKAGGGTLDDLIRLLSELPDDVSKIGNATRLAADIADQLHAAIATNPLLQSQARASTRRRCSKARTARRASR